GRRILVYASVEGYPVSMSRTSICSVGLLLVFPTTVFGEPPRDQDPLSGLREFIKHTALPGGSFRPGVDPNYTGISDSAYSDLAPVAYAVVIHKTFGWELPYEEKTRAWLLARQQDDGAFINVKGTVDSKSAQGRVYNTTMALMALHGLDTK